MQPKSNVNELVDHFFRNEFGKAVAFLTRKFGPSYLGEAEDAVQEALIKAMQSWPYASVPNNPTGWIIRVAQNALLDQIRKRQRVFYTASTPTAMVTEENEYPEVYFNDDIIKMMFACCNPALSQEYQLILTLRLLGGLSVKEIASALIKKDEAVAKALMRAKKQFKENNCTLNMPSQAQIRKRLKVVLKVIYLLFNEGYKSTEGDQLVRRELCDEAMRLNQLLLEKKETHSDWTLALMALMHFQASRFELRTDEHGAAVSLADQDRSRWDQRHIALGNRYLSAITDGLQNSYFIQAAISGIHANAKSFDETSWESILMLYDHLYLLNPNPVIALNRIIPLSKVKGEQEALKQLVDLEKEPSLASNYLLAATKAELYANLKNTEAARLQLKKAITQTGNQRERDFLVKKMELL